MSKFNAENMLPDHFRHFLLAKFQSMSVEINGQTDIFDSSIDPPNDKNINNTNIENKSKQRFTVSDTSNSYNVNNKKSPRLSLNTDDRSDYNNNNNNNNNGTESKVKKHLSEGTIELFYKNLPTLKEQLITVYDCSLWNTTIPVKGTMWLSENTLSFTSSFLRYPYIIKLNEIRSINKETIKTIQTIKIITQNSNYYFISLFKTDDIIADIQLLANISLRRVLKNAQSLESIANNNNNNHHKSPLHNNSDKNKNSTTNSTNKNQYISEKEILLNREIEMSPTKEQLKTAIRDNKIQTKFRLPNNETLILQFNCKLFKGNKFRKGTIYISSNFVCYQSIPYSNANKYFELVIPFQEIITITIENIEIGNTVITTTSIFTPTTQFNIDTIQFYQLMQKLHNENNNNSKEYPDVNDVWNTCNQLVNIPNEMLDDKSQFSNEFKIKDKEQTERWYKHFLKYGEGSTLKTNGVTKLIRNGIPNNVRGKQWLLWSGAYHYMLRNNRDYYQSLLSNFKGKETLATEEIEKDLLRSMPEHPYYQSEQGINSLKNVLVAYSWHNTSIGYCQSMNIIAALLLLYLPESHVFFLLCSICELLVPDYYIKQMLGSLVDQRIFEELITDRLPIIVDHLKSIGLPITFITLPLFLCLFIGYVPMEVSLRILDCFFYDGPNILISFALALFKLKQNEILSLDDGTAVINLLRTNTYDCDELLRVAFEEYESIPITMLDEKRYFQRSKAVKEMENKSKKGVLKELSKLSKFTTHELEDIYTQFFTVSANNQYLNYDQFQLLFKGYVPWYKFSINVIFDYLDKKKINCVELYDFVSLLSVLLKDSFNNQKIRMYTIFCCFYI